MIRLLKILLLLITCDTDGMTLVLAFISLQILKDDETRSQYDYAIAHPEEVICEVFYF